MLRRQTQGESRERETTSASSILTRAFYFFSLLLLKMLVKEERRGGGGGGVVVSLLLCVSSYLGNKPKHLLFLTVAHRDTHDLSLSLSLC